MTNELCPTVCPMIRNFLSLSIPFFCPESVIHPLFQSPGLSAESLLCIYIPKTITGDMPFFQDMKEPGQWTRRYQLQEALRQESPEYETSPAPPE